MEENKRIGSYTTTKRVRLYTNHIEKLKETQKIYNDTILKYYDLLLDNVELLELSNHNCLRELEKRTIKAKNGEIPENYFELDVPLYLRRAAINQAIGSAKNYITKMKNYEENIKTDKKAVKPNRATEFNSSIIFYKGMYKKISDNTIKIKLNNRKRMEMVFGKNKAK